MEKGEKGDFTVSPTDTSFDRDPPFAPGHIGEKPDCVVQSEIIGDQNVSPKIIAPQRPGTRTFLPITEYLCIILQI